MGSMKVLCAAGCLRHKAGAPCRWPARIQTQGLLHVHKAGALHSWLSHTQTQLLAVTG